MGKRIRLLFFVAVVGVAGCADAPQQAVPPAATKPRTAPAVTSLPTATEQKAELIYTYHSAGRRDPFMPIIIKEEKKALAGAKTPLERFSISEFKLSGIIWGGLGYHAMLEGPDGKGYFVRVGTVIGPNRGVIKKITQKTMIIEEKYKNPSGEVSKKEIIVELRRTQEGTL